MISLPDPFPKRIPGPSTPTPPHFDVKLQNACISYKYVKLFRLALATHR